MLNVDPFSFVYGDENRQDRLAVLYFNVGKTGRGQLADFAQLKGIPIPEAERWLAANLAYEPD